MKTMFIREGVNMTVDTETNEIGYISSAREAIQRIYVVPEPMHVVYQSGQHKEEADVEKNDIIVTFYTDEFDKRMIVVKSDEWTKNIEAYEKRIEKAKTTDYKCDKACEDCSTCEETQYSC